MLTDGGEASRETDGGASSDSDSGVREPPSQASRRAQAVAPSIAGAMT